MKTHVPSTRCTRLYKGAFGCCKAPRVPPILKALLNCGGGGARLTHDSTASTTRTTPTASQTYRRIHAYARAHEIM